MSTVRAPLARCETCQGKKKISGLGCMIKNCPDCNGIGWLEPTADPIESKPVNLEKLKNTKGEIIPAKRKYNRKPKAS